MSTNFYEITFAIAICNVLEVVDAVAFSTPTRLDVHLKSVSWNHASAICRGTGGILAEPSTLSKYHAIVTAIESDNVTAGYWLGISRSSETNEQFVYSSSCLAITDDLTIHNSSEPDRRCVVYNETVSFLRALRCARDRKFICETSLVDSVPRCTFQEIADRGIPDGLHPEHLILSSVVKRDVCIEQCLTSVLNDRECWAWQYSSGSLCSVFYATNADIFATNNEIVANSAIGLKQCYKVEINVNMVDQSHPVSQLSCSIGNPYTAGCNRNVTNGDQCNCVVETISECPLCESNYTCPLCSTHEPIDTSCATKTDPTTLDCSQCALTQSPCDPCVECSVCTTNCTNCPTDCQTCLSDPTCLSDKMGQTSINFTREQHEAFIKQIMESIAINKTLLSSTIRRYTSAKDDRQSAKSIGYMGAVALFGLFIGLLALDSDLLLRHGGVFIHNLRCLIAKDDGLLNVVIEDQGDHATLQCHLDLLYNWETNCQRCLMRR